jgi:hypothetical protein
MFDHIWRVICVCMSIKSRKKRAHNSASAPSYESSSRGRELLVTLISVMILIAQIALNSTLPGGPVVEKPNGSHHRKMSTAR